jgi:hypothetical protein
LTEDFVQDNHIYYTFRRRLLWINLK